MSRLVIISAAHKPYHGALMERSAARAGIEVVRFCEDKPWPNDFRVGKLVDGLECVKALPQDVTHVMFLDSSDSLVIGGPKEIVSQYESRGYDVLMQAEKNCYPDAALAAEYPQQKTSYPWRFLNSGGWVARRNVAATWMRYAAKQAEYCDQLCWTKAFLKSAPIRLDESCSVFQSMYLQEPGELTLKNGRVTNHVTVEQPCVLHWNGTRNAGILPRAGVWACLGIESQKSRKAVAA